MLMINEILVHHLITMQFPQWKDLPIKPVEFKGWDNRTFHLGKDMLVRMPSAQEYASQVEKEQLWLPKLAPLLPLSIPSPLAMGEPTKEYPWKWSIYLWLDGEPLAAAKITHLDDIAENLAHFLVALQNIDTSGGPLPGPQSFYRGAALINYDAQARQAIAILADKINALVASNIWETALATTWQYQPVWVHGDMAAGNLLIKYGRLSAVIDFGQLAIGDPACDLTIFWTFFKDQSRKIFSKILSLDTDTWARARGWALWKALIISAELVNATPCEKEQAWRIINEVLLDPII